MSGDPDTETRWGILGPLEVHCGESPVVLRGRHHPKALALLLTEAGRMVSAESLVGALWEDTPPATAERQVSNIIGALRRQLGAAGSAITTVGNGYRITVPASGSDLGRFRQAVATTRRERQADRLPEALAAARFGLAQWRGPALAGLTGRTFDAIARQLEAARLELLGERIDLEIELGAHREVIGELTELVTEDPTRQRFVGQLMLALYRDGRAPEALDAYRRTRDRLAEELGIDPGQALRDLNTAVLRDDPALRPTAAAGNPAPRPVEAPPTESPQGTVPAQLPAATAAFTGRESVLTRLDALAGEHPVVVSGAGGTGKTAVVLHWAHRDRSRFPDGQLYLNLRGFDRREPLEPLAALRSLLRSLGLSPERIPDDEAAASAELRSQLADRRMLLLLDNARDVAQVRPLLPGTRDVTVVVTSRNRLAGLAALDDARLLRLPELNTAESRTLLTRLLRDAPVPVSPRTVTELADLCGGLPLALRIAAANLTSGSHPDPDRYVTRLRENRGATDFTVDADPESGLTATFALSLDALRPEDRRALLRLARVPGDDVRDGLAEAVAGATDGSSLARLEAAHLVERYRPHRIRFHDLVREFLLQRADAEYPEDAAVVPDQVVDWYVENRKSLTGDDLGNFLDVAEAYLDLPRSWELISFMSVFFQYGFGEDRGIRLVTRALDRARAEDNLPGQSRLLITLAGHHWVKLNMGPAIRYGEQALDIAERLDDSFELGKVVSNLGLFCYAANRYPEAERHYRRSVELARQDGDASAEFLRLSNWAGTKRVQARFDDAWELLEQAEKVASRTELTTAPVLNLLCSRARIRLDQGRFDEAIVHIERLIVEADRLGSMRYGMMGREFLADVRLRTGDPAGAVEELSRVLAARVKAGNRRTADALANLARAACEVGDRELALDSLAKAESAFDELTPSTKAGVWRTRARIAMRGWIADSPVVCAQHAVRLCEPLGAPVRLARALADLATAHLSIGDPVAAEVCRRRASELFARHGVPDDTGQLSWVVEPGPNGSLDRAAS